MTPLLHLPVFLTAAVALVTSSVFKAPDGNFELLILHNNDMHARFEQTSQLSGACTTADREAGKCYGGFPRVAHVVKEARKAAASGEGPPVLYLNAGDTYTGTAWFTIYKWKVAAEFLNALQPDAVSLGNHEFDEGISGLTPFIRNLSCPVLAANLILNKEPSLQAEQNLMKSVIININGIKIAIIGYLTPETKWLATRNDVEYIEEIRAIKNEIDKLNKSDIYIALGHSGYLKDLKIAKEVEDIDVVIGGHTNTFLWNGTAPDIEEPVGPYPALVKQVSGKIVPVVQAYAYTKYLGKLHLVFNNEGNLISFDGNPILLDKSVPQDPEVLKIVNKYREDIVKITETVLGNISVVLDGHSCRLKECNMGNLICDAIVHKYASEYIGDGWTDAPVSIIHGGSIRASVAHVNLPTNITKGDLITVMPFDGNLVKISMTGRDVREMLEQSVAHYHRLKTSGQFLQVSGLKVEYDLQKPPRNRVKSVYIRCGKCYIPAYAPLNNSEIYTILAPSFLTIGGDGYSVFVNNPSTNLEYNELQSTIEYIQKHKPQYPGIEGRIILHNAERLTASSATLAKTSLFISVLPILFINL